MEGGPGYRGCEIVASWRPHRKPPIESSRRSADEELHRIRRILIYDTRTHVGVPPREILWRGQRDDRERDGVNRRRVVFPEADMADCGWKRRHVWGVGAQYVNARRSREP